MRGAARSAWDDFRERERNAEALAGSEGDYPSRYRKLLEQYYRELGRSSAQGE